MKKVLSIIFIIALMLALVSCFESPQTTTTTMQATKATTTTPTFTTTTNQNPPEDPPAEDKHSKGLEFTLNDDNASYSVTGIGNCTDTNIVIPETYNGLPVTAIRDMAFIGINLNTAEATLASQITSIIIPDTVSVIGAGAFYFCFKLQNIKIPDSVTSIGENAFSLCLSLTSIEIDENNKYYKSIDGNLYDKSETTLLQYARGKSDKTFSIPDGVTKIASYAFYGATSLVIIELPYSLTEIGDYAFSYCSLRSVELEKNVKIIGNKAFEYCVRMVEVVNNSSLDIVAGSSDYGGIAYYANDVHAGESHIDNVDEYLFYRENGINYIIDYVGYDTELVFPDNYNGEKYQIQKNAFEDDNSIISVVISNGVTVIGEGAFRYCDSLMSISIGKNVTKIEWDAFDKIELVEIINHSQLDIQFGALEVHNGESKLEKSGNFFFYTYKGVNYLVKYIGEEENPTLPENYKDESYEIYKYAFNSNNTIKTIIIPDSVTSIGNSAFFGCGTLTSIEIPDSVTNIGSNAFGSCLSLTSITIPDSVTSIGNSAFSSCTSLTSIEVDKNNAYYKSIDGNLYDKSVKTLIKYAMGKKDTTFVIPDSVTSIGDCAFSDCTSLTSITIPDSVTSIGNSAFSTCTSLTSIEIPDSVTSIGGAAFYNCTLLESINFTGTVEQWEAIDKNFLWKSGIPATEVVCSNGTVSLK